MLRKGRLVTPGVNADILEGITRSGIIEIARRELGLECDVRPIDRSELYVADEVFLCGTGAQVSPVASIDHRTVGDGKVGAVTAAIMAAYFDAVRGRSEAYRDWVVPVYRT
jgi:branched-chain amino acid aminotransferase